MQRLWPSVLTVGMFVVGCGSGAKGVYVLPERDVGPQCQRLLEHFSGCGIESLIVNPFSVCREPTSRCEIDCLVATTCTDLQTYFCDSALFVGLDVCLNYCSSRTFVSCDNGAVLGATCDGMRDCEDGTDEDACSEFVCTDGEEVTTMVACDGVADCADGSDESPDRCFSCDGWFPPSHLWCDGFSDCSDGSDENLDCPYFVCGSGEQISAALTCNGRDDCSDGSDERTDCDRRAIDRVCE